MTVSRISLAGALGVLAACGDATSPTPSSSAVAPGIVTTIEQDAAAVASLPGLAARYAALGRPELSKWLATPVTPRYIVSCPSFPCDKGGTGTGNPTNTNYGNTPGPVGTPAPNNPASLNAVIFASATTASIAGTNGLIVSWVSYYGNQAVNTIHYTVTKNGANVRSDDAVGEGKGDSDNIAPSWWDRAFNYRHTTKVFLDNLPACGVTISATGNHEARWQTFPLAGVITSSKWGQAFANDGATDAKNDYCVELQKRQLGPGSPNRGNKGGETSQCYFCIHWGWFAGDVMVSDEWECHPIPNYVCGYAFAVPKDEIDKSRSVSPSKDALAPADIRAYRRVATDEHHAT